MQARWRSRRWIVDGHNMIFALPGLGRLQRDGDRRRARQELESLLLAFAAHLESPLIIVYDGNEMACNPDAQQRPALETIYSQPPEEADDRIIYLATQCVARAEAVCVVTNDRNSLMPRLPAEVSVLSVEEFRTRHLAPRTAPDGPPEKQLSAAERQEIEHLLLAHAQNDPQRGARQREREAIRRWRARVGEREHGDRQPRREEPGGWRAPTETPRAPTRPQPAALPAKPEPECAPGVDAAAREAKRARGERAQKRRLAAQQRGTRRTKKGAKKQRKR